MRNAATLQSLQNQQPLLLALYNGGVCAAGIDGIAVADMHRAVQRIGVNYLSVDDLLQLCNRARHPLVIMAVELFQ